MANCAPYGAFIPVWEHARSKCRKVYSLGAPYGEFCAIWRMAFPFGNTLRKRRLRLCSPGGLFNTRNGATEF